MEPDKPKVTVYNDGKGKSQSWDASVEWSYSYADFYGNFNGDACGPTESDARQNLAVGMIDMINVISDLGQGSPPQLDIPEWRPAVEGHRYIRQVEIEDLESLLAMATEFDCGVLLPQAPKGWKCGLLSSGDFRKGVGIRAEVFESGDGYVVSIPGGPFESFNLTTDGRWISFLEGPGLGDCNDDDEVRRTKFPDALEAFRALERWRAAELAKIAEAKGGSL